MPSISANIKNPTVDIIHRIGSILISSKIYDQNSTNEHFSKILELIQSKDTNAIKEYVVTTWNEATYSKIEQHIQLMISIN